MKTSETVAELTKSLIAFQQNVKQVERDALNPFFNSKYATLSSIWDTIRKPLSENGLAIIQAFEVGEKGTALVTMLAWALLMA